jgi:hypothetical protein
MGAIRHTRRDPPRRDGSAHGTRPDPTPALGTWFNCNLETGEILSLSLSPAEGDGGLILRAFGADDPSPCDWGQTPAIPHVSGLGSREVGGFTARYDFGFMETQIAANLKYGVLVIQSYNTFKDGSGRPPYFIREFFHQDLGREAPAARRAGAGSPAIPGRMAGDLPLEAGWSSPGTVDLSPLLGRWRNTYRKSKGIHRVALAREGDRYMLRGWGVGCDEDWGSVPVVPHAIDVASRRPAGFLARYDFGFSELSLAANEFQGLLIIAAFSTFRDGSGRSSYFTREFFYREGDGPSS